MPELTDEQRYDFLVDLDESDVTVTEWEAEFLDKIITTEQCDFSPKQRQAIARMYDRYTGRGVM